jgi:mycoredoxin
LALVALVIGVALAATLFASGSPGSGVAELVVFVVLALVLSPVVFPRSVSAAEALRRQADEGTAIVYWRPGCQFCLRLRVRLGADGRRASWVNIWADEDGAAAVRSVAGGNETVPTVVIAGEATVNPDPRGVRSRLRGT